MVDSLGDVGAALADVKEERLEARAGRPLCAASAS
jgi:hypothetical protein